MFLSVVMSVFNAEKYIQEAIKSVLNQTYSNFEFIIINDGSNDKSLEIIKKFTPILENISRERVKQELDKTIVLENNIQALEDLKQI